MAGAFFYGTLRTGQPQLSVSFKQGLGLYNQRIV
jgi:hypothetical protein